jgi:hypothetical protein
MAPEQITGAAIDARADVFALGAMFFRIVSGRFPFVADRPEAYLTACLSTAPSRLDEVADVPRALADVVADALASNPKDRIPDARTFAAALTNAVHPPAVTEETLAMGKALPRLYDHADADSVHTALMPSPKVPSTPPPARAAMSSVPFAMPIPSSVPPPPSSAPQVYPRHQADSRRLAPTVSTHLPPPRTGRMQIALVFALLTISLAAFVGAVLMLPSASAKHVPTTLELKRDAAKLTSR